MAWHGQIPSISILMRMDSTGPTGAGACPKGKRNAHQDIGIIVIDHFLHRHHIV
jgi:hypothetical protein